MGLLASCVITGLGWGDDDGFGSLLLRLLLVAIPERRSHKGGKAEASFNRLDLERCWGSSGGPSFVVC